MREHRTADEHRQLDLTTLQWRGGVSRVVETSLKGSIEFTCVLRQDAFTLSAARLMSKALEEGDSSDSALFTLSDGRQVWMDE